MRGFWHVTTLVVVWIEIMALKMDNISLSVTTLVVVWIEIIIVVCMTVKSIVTTLVVVWIEILFPNNVSGLKYCHHSRSGVD